jgi:REP element-mobilizing transposase RayT
MEPGITAMTASPSIEENSISFELPESQPNDGLVKKERSNQSHESVEFTRSQREAVYFAIREVCRFRGYQLLALNIRSNHVHVVVIARVAPEKIIEAFKSYATRRLKNDSLIDADRKVWSRHGSTRYLWKEQSVTAAIDYVLYGQGEDIPEIF